MTSDVRVGRKIPRSYRFVSEETKQKALKTTCLLLCYILAPRIRGFCRVQFVTEAVTAKEAEGRDY